MRPRLNLRSYTVTRRALVAPVLGRKQAPTVTTITIIGDAQPLDGRDLRMIPQARWTEDLRKLFTSTELYTASATYDCDLVAIGGAVFEVFKCAPWAADHFEVLLAKVVQR